MSNIIIDEKSSSFYYNGREKIVGMLSTKYPSVEAMQAKEPDLLDQEGWQNVKTHEKEMLETPGFRSKDHHVAYLLTDKEGLALQAPVLIFWFDDESGTWRSIATRKGYVCKEWENYNLCKKEELTAFFEEMAIDPKLKPLKMKNKMNSTEVGEVPFIDYMGFDNACTDYCYQQHGGTLKASETFVAMEDHQIRATDIMSLNYGYHSIDEMVQSNPQFEHEYTHCLRAMRNIEKLMRREASDIRVPGMSYDYGKDVFSHISGLQSFSMRLKGDTDVMVVSFHYCDSISTSKKLKAGDIYKGTIEIAITQLSGNNVGLFQFQNIAYDKLSDAVKERDGYCEYDGNYAALIERMLNLFFNLKIVDFKIEEDCTDVVSIANSIMINIDEARHQIASHLNYPHNSKEVNGYLRNIERFLEGSEFEDERIDCDCSEILALPYSSASEAIEDQTLVDDGDDAEDEFNSFQNLMGDGICVMEQLESFLEDDIDAVHCSLSFGCDLQRDDEGLTAASFTLRIKNDETGLTADFIVGRDFKSSEEKVTAVQYVSDENYKEVSTARIAHELIAGYIELINGRTEGGWIPARTPLTYAEVATWSMMRYKLDAVMFGPE